MAAHRRARQPAEKSPEILRARKARRAEIARARRAVARDLDSEDDMTPRARAIHDNKRYVAAVLKHHPELEIRNAA